MNEPLNDVRDPLADALALREADVPDDLLIYNMEKGTGRLVPAPAALQPKEVNKCCKPGAFVLRF